MKTIAKWSYSGLDLFLSCSLAWFYRYVAEVPEEQVPAALPFGSALHAAHERVYRDLKEKGAFDPETAVVEFATNWEMLAQNPLLVFKDGEDFDGLLEKGVEMLKVFAKAVKPEKVVDVDLAFEIPVGANGTMLHGFMDLVVEQGEGLCVVEFKSAGRKWSQADADEALQASVYSLAARRLFPGRDVAVRYDVLTKVKKPELQSLSTKRGRWDEERVVNLVAAAQDAVDKGVFFPSRSFRCAGCAYALRCQAWRFEPAETVTAAA